MSQKEQNRFLVMDQVRSGGISLKEATGKMQVSYRQAKRIYKRFKKHGPAGLVHQSRGRISNRRLSPELRKQVLDMYQTHLNDYGPTLASEVLKEDYGLKVNPETLRKWLHGANIWVSKQRHRTHRKRRKRRSCFGAMVQIDGSHHAWFEDRGSPCCMMVAVDDATGRTLCYASPQETTDSAFRILQKWIVRYGVPMAIYVDRKNIYSAGREPTLEERRAGTGALTHFGLACHRLGIQIILAHSPEAKGRVERRNGVLQDRLVKEMRRLNITNIDQTNAFLDDFTRRLDEKFAIEPRSSSNQHRISPGKRALSDILCWEETRSVRRDWTVTCSGETYQIHKQANQPRPKDRVTIRRRMDGRISLLWRGRNLSFRSFGEPAHKKHIVQRKQLPHPHGGGGDSFQGGHF